MPTGHDYIPKPDGAFDHWQNNLIAVIGADPQRFGLNDAQMIQLRQGSGTWESAYNSCLASQDAYHAAVGYKQNARSVYENQVRDIARVIEANSGVPAEAKREAGLPVHDTQHSPVPPPDVAPLGECEAGRRLEHRLNFRPIGARKRGKPAGVTHCEVWRKKGGAAPVDSAECEMIDTPQRSPCVIKYAGADAGKTIHYMLRYVSTRGTPGPWSETVSATVLG